MPNEPTTPSKGLLGSPLRIALIYLALAFLWIAVADLILDLLPPHSTTFNRLAFTLVTGLALYFVASRYAQQLRKSTSAEKEAAARARAFFESAVEGIVQVESDGKIRQMNPRALAMFGYADGEIVGQPVEVLIPTRLRDRHVAHRLGFSAAPRSRRMGVGLEVVAVRRDGTEFPAEVSLSHVVYGSSSRYIAFVADITERRLMEREARRTETLNALGAMAAGAVHELNNPLAVITSRIELMLSGEQPLSPEVREDLLVLQRNAVRAGRISRNLLSLARHRPTTRVPLDINGSIEEIVLLLFSDARSSGARVELALDRDIPRVMGDQTGLEQVIVNLLMNARDAGANHIRVASGTDPDRSGWIRIVVSDNGSGVPPDALTKVFDPFYTTKQQGTGLGLWLSQRLVNDHGGKIEVTSTPGRGATFSISLPGLKATPHEPSRAPAIKRSA